MYRVRLAVIHSPTSARVSGRPGSRSATTSEQGPPRFRDERIWGRGGDERESAAGGEAEDADGEKERARERRSCLGGVHSRRRRGGSLPTYPKFQPVLPPPLPLPSLPRVVSLPLPVLPGESPPSPSRPPRLLTWRLRVSCGRLASPSAARELVYSAEHALCAGPCLLPLVLLFRTRNRHPALSLSLPRSLSSTLLFSSFLRHACSARRTKIHSSFVYVKLDKSRSFRIISSSRTSAEKSIAILQCVLIYFRMAGER